MDWLLLHLDLYNVTLVKLFSVKRVTRHLQNSGIFPAMVLEKESVYPF